MSMTTRALALAGALAAGFLTAPDALAAQSTAELDAYWAELARTVEEGDFEGYAATYHEDAVFVSDIQNGGAGVSYPIASALAGWKQLFDDTKSGDAKASVTFRFTRRLSDETTAHEVGMFNYRFGPADGEAPNQYTHFESLLVKKDGKWKMIMEYQKAIGTQEEWDAARR